MKNITFKNIYKSGQIVQENDLYIHVHNPEMLLQYDSNYIAFKKMPTTEEFKAAESYLKTYHEKYGQKHVRFYFPEGVTLTPELMYHFKDDAYFLFGFQELYSIQPDQFPAVKDHPEIDIQSVSNETLDVFLKFQYELDSANGNDFADQKQGQHLRNFKDEKIVQIIAFYNGKIAGSLDVIISDDTAEIDGFMVHEDFQKKGIGSRMQKYVMNRFSDKTVILVADGEDTAREMYQKQNYQFLDLQYNALKVYQF
ncbi:MAG TPA: GNAT family N-acetyltransferase [Pseudoneobacillus sp.]|nr:GNAT family N-acetyltransferase [Pseudoneobacillus sp.]